MKENVLAAKEALQDVLDILGELKFNPPTSNFGHRQLAFKLSDALKLLADDLTPLGLVGTLADVFTIVGRYEKDELGEENKALLIEVMGMIREVNNNVNKLREEMEDHFDDMKHFIQVQDIWKQLRETGDSDYTLWSSWMDYNAADLSQTLRESYGATFSGHCTSSIAPYLLFKEKYRLGCNECNLFNNGLDSSRGYSENSSVNGIMHIVLNEAKAKYPNDESERMLWFSNNFLVPLLEGMILDLFLHSVCIYHGEPTCHEGDGPRMKKTETMFWGMDEVIQSGMDGQLELLASEVPSMAPSTMPSDAPHTACKIVMGMCV